LQDHTLSSAVVPSLTALVVRHINIIDCLEIKCTHRCWAAFSANPSIQPNPTPWIWVIKTLPVTQLIKKPPTFYRNWSFILLSSQERLCSMGSVGWSVWLVGWL